MRIVKTNNAELVKSVVTHPQVWVHLFEDWLRPEAFVPNPEAAWLALLDDGPDGEFTRGVAVALPRSPKVVDFRIAFLPQYWRSPNNVALGKLALSFILGHVSKVVASVPNSDRAALRYAQRIGMKREGISKFSYLRDGKMLDQTYFGAHLEAG